MSSISIQISDDDSDNCDSPSMPPTSSLLKPRNIRSRQHILQDFHENQNQRHQSFGQHSKKKNETLIRAFLIIIKNRWGLLVFFPLFSFILFGLWRIFSITHQDMGRVDPNLRVSVKRKQSCLKLLDQEELENLEIPSMVTPRFPVKRVVYISDSDGSDIGANITSPRQPSESTRFNMFTGYQTIHQREQSYKVNETAAVHCGFYSENGGFKISDEDKSYTQTCQIVVSTCAFGGGDDLFQPVGMSLSSLKKVCYVAFWDEITLQIQEADGHKIDDNHMIGIWRVIVVQELPFADQRLNGKIPKILAHRLFPQARYSIWVDSKSQFRQDPLGVLEALLWRTGSVLAISEHGARSSIYDEGKAVVEKNKATSEEVEAQLFQYRQDGFPNEKKFNGKKEYCFLQL
ncbi:uncharacterized protein LOC111308620 isoform X2 [Durio zibethinus]|uniref:Uncharacterized protein LOC111308620 isoform X2 n=1 Tax=Durio zibethinus TaxID=66656 RepID=A0A6P6AD66_DURZI|nr:uncharacterized protein LOC111308620 isoform X2 [Durio zibethinus]